MVFLELVSMEGDEVTYDYMPESKDAPRGTLSVNRSTGVRTLHSKSSDDELPWYRCHAWSRIDEMIVDGNLESVTASAWY